MRLAEETSKLQLEDASEGQAPAPSSMRGQVIAILLDSAPRTWGSREEMHLRFSRALIERGARPVLVFSEEIPDELRKRYFANGVDVAPAINYEKGVFGYYRGLGKIVREYSVTAVHIAFFNYFSLVPWLARLNGVRYVVYHERNPGVLRARFWKKWLLQIRGRAVALPMTRVVAISRFVERQLVDVGIPGQKITVVYNGIDVRRYSPNPSARARLASEFSVQPGEIVMASLSYLDRPHKNIDIVIEACRQLGERGVAVRWLLIGDGEMRRELQALAEKQGVASRIHWLGHIVDPVPILQGCDVFVMVSEGEGFGLALAEALACGATAVAARSGALTEVVEDGRSGILVAPRDAAALAEAIERLATDGTLRRRFLEHAREHVRGNFTVEVSIQNMMKVYASIWR